MAIENAITEKSGTFAKFMRVELCCTGVRACVACVQKEAKKKESRREGGVLAKQNIPNALATHYCNVS